MDDIKIEFRASLPQIQSSIKIGQDSARIQLDVPAIDIAEATKMAFLHGQVLKITVEIDDAETSDSL